MAARRGGSRRPGDFPLGAGPRGGEDPGTAPRPPRGVGAPRPGGPRPRLYLERLGDGRKAGAPRPTAARQRILDLARRLDRACRATLRQRAERVDSLSSQLRHLNPRAVLERGYGIVRNGRGEILRDSGQVEENEDILVTLAHGRLDARVTRRESGD